MNSEKSLFRRIATFLTTPQEIKRPDASAKNGARGSLRIGVAALVVLAVYLEIAKHNPESSTPLVPGVSFSRMSTFIPNSILP